MRHVNCRPLFKALALAQMLLVLVVTSSAYALNKKIVDVANIERLPMSSSERATKLVEAGETLLTPYSFMYAYEVFQLALHYDGKNHKAKLYSAFIKPLMNFRGALTRIEPVVSGYDNKTKESYERLKTDLGNGSFKFFMMDGQADIKTESQIQALLEKVQADQQAYRLFLKSNKDMKLQLTLNVSISASQDQALSLGGMKREMFRECDVKVKAQNVYEMTDCKYLDSKTVSVERADIETLQHIAAGFQMFTVFATAYRLDGVIDLDRVSKTMDLTDQDYSAYFGAIKEFGFLKQSHQLGLVITLGSDGLAGIKWYHKWKQRLCQRGEHDPQNRQGFLFNKGICIPDTMPRLDGKRDFEGQSVDDFFKTFEVILAGMAIDIYGYDQFGNEIKTQAVYTAPLHNPVPNLKNLLPTEFNECGNATNVGDETLGGIFPNGDANSFLLKAGQLDRKCN